MMLQFQANRSTHYPPSALEDWAEHWRNVQLNDQAGFANIALQREGALAVKARVATTRPAPRILVIGIGGSSLGAQVIHKSLAGRAPLIFLDSPDPQTWREIGDFSNPRWRDQHVVLVSKSGGTLETLTWIEQIHASNPGWLQSCQCTVIASPVEGSLQKWAKQNEIPCLWIPENVGGRFSVLTAAGLFPAALMGLDIDQMSVGAEWSLGQRELSAKMCLEIVNSLGRGEWITQLWTFSQALGTFGDWWQQLWGESLAKRVNRSGKPAPRMSTPMPCQGPRDQHSILQQLMEGAHDKYIFIQRVAGLSQSNHSFKASLFPDAAFYGRQISLGQVIEAEAIAFERSLKDVQVPCSVLTMDQLSEQSLGALFMLWQMVIAQLGEGLDIDAFNQPGVELGKRYAVEILLGKN